MATRINWKLLDELQSDCSATGSGASLQAMKELHTGLKQLVFLHAYTPDVPESVKQEVKNRRRTLSVYIELEERLRFQIKPLDNKGKLW